MTILDLKKELQSKKLKNLYIFTGEEKGMMNIYLDKIDCNYIIAESFESITPKLLSFGLFSSKCTYVIKNDKNIESLEVNELIPIIGKNKVIFIMDNIDGRKAFYKKLKDYIVQFDKLTIEQLVPFIQGKCNMSKELAVLLAIRCNLDILKIEFECNKISNLNTTVTKELIDELIVPTIDDVIFDLTKSVAINDTHSSFQYLNQLLFSGHNGVEIIGLLYRSFRNILLVQGYKDLQNRDIAAKTKLTIGAVYHTREIINYFTLDELLNILKLLQQADVNIKSGKEEANITAQRVLCEILK